MLGKLLSFTRRRALSRYADEKTVSDFTRVVEQTGILSETDRVAEAARLIEKGDPEDCERIAKLLSD